MRVDRGNCRSGSSRNDSGRSGRSASNWERHPWSPFVIDLSTDAASFAALDEATGDGLVRVFAHRFQAESMSPHCSRPFLLAAPGYDMQLLLATQMADEHRHIESVLRVYSDVFAVEGGIAAVRASPCNDSTREHDGRAGAAGRARTSRGGRGRGFAGPFVDSPSRY